jgi:hypothetical protein
MEIFKGPHKKSRHVIYWKDFSGEAGFLGFPKEEDAFYFFYHFTQGQGAHPRIWGSLRGYLCDKKVVSSVKYSSSIMENVYCNLFLTPWFFAKIGEDCFRDYVFPYNLQQDWGYKLGEDIAIADMRDTKQKSEKKKALGSIFHNEKSLVVCQDGSVYDIHGDRYFIF